MNDSMLVERLHADLREATGVSVDASLLDDIVDATLALEPSPTEAELAAEAFALVSDDCFQAELAALGSEADAIVATMQTVALDRDRELNRRQHAALMGVYGKVFPLPKTAFEQKELREAAQPLLERFASYVDRLDDVLEQERPSSRIPQEADVSNDAVTTATLKAMQWLRRAVNEAFMFSSTIKVSTSIEEWAEQFGDFVGVMGQFVDKLELTIDLMLQYAVNQGLFQMARQTMPKRAGGRVFLELSYALIKQTGVRTVNARKAEPVAAPQTSSSSWLRTVLSWLTSGTLLTALGWTFRHYCKSIKALSESDASKITIGVFGTYVRKYQRSEPVPFVEEYLTGYIEERASGMLDYREPVLYHYDKYLYSTAGQLLGTVAPTFRDAYELLVGWQTMVVLLIITVSVLQRQRVAQATTQALNFTRQTIGARLQGQIAYDDADGDGDPQTSIAERIREHQQRLAGRTRVDDGGGGSTAARSTSPRRSRRSRNV